MKKIAYTALTAVAVLLVACSSESYHKDAGALPAGPRSEVETNFDSKVVGVKVESNTFGDDDYEATLEDGTRIEYKGDQWTEVQAGIGKSVPDKYLPVPVLTFVTTNYPGIQVTKIERNKEGYEIELSNGLEVSFDPNGAFLKYED